ncbi:hypothetical protein A5647_23375 [Mycobacterium sp. 1100029.7]|nr:hypothetical protein A5647_23375 [Mycobacterium sp. 1100029.7]
MSGVVRISIALSVAVLAVCPVATADPGSASYLQGIQAVDIQFYQHHVRFPADIDWASYCQEDLKNVLKSGIMHQVDSGPDFIAGCTDEGRRLLATQ